VAHYLDIVPDRRIVCSCAMRQDERKMSASPATVGFMPEGVGSRPVITGQGAFLDSWDDAARAGCSTICTRRYA
jgi:uncharacterized protein YndB with AHSA1/START domain